MDTVYVFSKSPLACSSESLDIEWEKYGGGYRYMVRPKCEPDSLYGFIFSGLTDSIAKSRLRGAGIASVGEAGEMAGIFSQRLAAYLCVTGNRSKIMEIIKTVLSENGVIDIDGLVTFRLGEFARDISAFFDMLFYEYNVRRQYDDFITLLRDYVRLEGPREEAVHIVFRGGGFVLYNSKMANITYSALKNYNNDFGFSEGNLNDFLISSLIHYIPEKIIIHSENPSVCPPSRIIETISLIFKGRVTHCSRSGCELCAEREGAAPLSGFNMNL